MVKDKTKVRWPTRFDYDIAMQNMRDTILDPELSSGRIASTSHGVVHFDFPHSLVSLYRINDWMVRCFCRNENIEPDESITERYQQLSKFIWENQTRVSALVPLDFFAKGMKVVFFEYVFRAPVSVIKEEIVPIVKMPFVVGLSLGTFIASNYRNSKKMNQLSAAWLRMIHEMEAVQMAHGDLDLSNVLVQEVNGKLLLKLIDYDNSWIPGFDYTLPEYGHEPFQHPTYFGKLYLYNHKIDRFSALVIYLSLKAIGLHPDLYKQFGADEARLLFSSVDYKAEQNKSSEGNISILQAMGISELAPYIDELRASLHENRLPHRLDDIIPPSTTYVAEIGLASHREPDVQVTQKISPPLASLSSPIKIVFCYAHEDKEYLNKLKNHLTPLRQQGVIDVWYDRDIGAGEERIRAMEEKLNTARIIVVLVSADFLNSDYYDGKEMKYAMKRHKSGEATVIPVILRHVDWKETPLGILQPLPRNVPIQHGSWSTIDEAFYEVEKGIKDVIERINSASSADSSVQERKDPYLD